MVKNTKSYSVFIKSIQQVLGYIIYGTIQPSD